MCSKYVAQPAKRLSPKQKAAGSNPAGYILFDRLWFRLKENVYEIYRKKFMGIYGNFEIYVENTFLWYAQIYPFK